MDDRKSLPWIEGTWRRDDLRRAFVAGAKWWEFESRKATMWASDRALAEAEAERVYPKGKPARVRRLKP
jgi:hypothetical protein